MPTQDQPAAPTTPEHTPGEMKVDGTTVFILDIEGVNRMTADVQRGSTRSTVAEMEANARRIAACWNACEHFTTKDLESIGVGPYMEAAYGKGDNDGVRLIALERVRQVLEKGYDTNNDDAYDDGELSDVGACIAIHPDTDAAVSLPIWGDKLADHVAAKYAGDRIRQLTIAGALIAAEIDRLRRKAAQS